MQFATLQGSSVISPQSPGHHQRSHAPNYSPNARHPSHPDTGSVASKIRLWLARSHSSHVARRTQSMGQDVRSYITSLGLGSSSTCIVFRASLLNKWVAVWLLGGGVSKIGAVRGGGLGCCGGHGLAGLRERQRNRLEDRQHSIRFLQSFK